MTRRDKEVLFDMLAQIRAETHQNNVMLSEICDVVNTYLANHHRENEDDFGRNVLANLISSTFDLRKVRRR